MVAINTKCHFFDRSDAVLVSTSFTDAYCLLPNASSIPFTFSTKAVDASGLSYYGFRFYNAELGRWLSRDPIREKGGLNQYAMCLNSLISRYDTFGLAQDVPKNKDAEAAALLIIIDYIDNIIHHGGSIPDSGLNIMNDGLKNTPQVKRIVSSVGVSKCSAGEGIYPINITNDISYNQGDILELVFGGGVLKGVGAVVVVATTNNDCKSFLRYMTEIAWSYNDKADFRSFIDGDWDKKLIKEWEPWTETALDALFDKLGNADFDFHLHWTQQESECCP
jgi:RHS repeat-associated protein